MNWSKTTLKEYRPPPRPLTRSEKVQLKHQQRKAKELEDAQYIKEIVKLERQLAKVREAKSQQHYQGRSKYPTHTPNSEEGREEGKDPAFFTVLTPSEVVACEECGQEMPINQLTKHHSRTCPGRYVSCQKPGCSSRFRAVDRAKHEKFKCKTVAKNNRYAMAATKHANALPCPLGCSMGVTKKDRARHVNSVCPNRKITCPHDGCMVRLSITEMKMHASKKCAIGMKRNAMAASSNSRRKVPVQCSPHHEMGCGQMILPKDMKKHETIDCPHRLTLCRHKGCNEMIAFNILSFHENNICKVMLANEKKEMEKEEKSKLEYGCPLGCGEYMFTNETSWHTKNDCTHREVTCSITGCGLKMPFHELVKHEMIWDRKIDQASQKFYYVNPDTEETVWEDPGCKLLRLRDFYLEKYLSRPKIVLCKLGCRTALKNQIKVIRNHLLNDCPNEIITCQSKGNICTKTFLRRKQEEHNNTDCVVGQRSLQLARQGTAQRMLINCPYCDIEMQMKHLKRHTRHECPRRLVPCKYWDCKVKCPANGHHIHVLTECDHRKKWEEGVAAARERVRLSGGKPFLPACFREEERGGEREENNEKK